MSEYVAKEMCEVQHQHLIDRLERIEEQAKERDKEFKVVSEAVVKIQVSSDLMAQALNQLVQKVDGKSGDKNFELLKLTVTALIAIAGALLGTKLL